ncbi:hypothetical protein DFQ10_10376 [Winogradskyella eximia]|uniref:Uncharacterized protein n=1 Tax=Winogradskyella eximia TaxID=262006 RepID=A0A3D9H4G7_9FLAO|nr:hypothetical protein [Winogradskyella eximia]RED44393.1 hypothetical protein DFQ10_10376 [Winogradskyella eximia]
MYTIISEEEKLRHPYYKIMDLSKDKLQVELNSWCRLDLIDWLAWNDRNGIYRDEDSLLEMGNILGKADAIEIIKRQILE